MPARPTSGLLLLSLLAVGSACAKDIEPWLRTPAVRAALFRGAPSYGAPAETLRALGLAQASQVERRHRGRSQGCLARSFRYDVRLITLPAADHGFAGSLELTFLNDKLVRTTFRPVRGEAYLAALLRSSPLVARGGPGRRAERLGGAAPHTRVEVQRGRAGLAVTWSDTRLIKAYWEVQSRGSSRYLE